MEERRHGLIGPLILITIGVLFLLVNLNLLAPSFWGIAARFWPLLLILIGLDLIIGRRSAVGAIIVAVLWIVLVGGAIWLSSPQGSAYLPTTPTTSDEVAIPLGDIKSASISLDNGLSVTTVGPLGPDATDLVSGTFRHPDGVSISQNYRVVGTEGRLALVQQGASWAFWVPGESRWDLKLSPRVPIALSVNGGVGRLTLDLNGLAVTSLNINSGVGSVEVITPGSGAVTMRLNGGVGSSTIIIPSGMSARIRTNGGLGSINIDPSRFPRLGDTYQSADYAAAANKIDIEIDGGLGSINVR
jgi:hypothetical protein